MTLSRIVLLLCSLSAVSFSAVSFSAVSLGCGNDYSDERCDDILRQIRAAMEDNVSKGILVRDAIACGEDGVANRTDSFDVRVAPSDVEYLQGAFRNACDEYQDHC